MSKIEMRAGKPVVTEITRYDASIVTATKKDRSGTYIALQGKEFPGAKGFGDKLFFANKTTEAQFVENPIPVMSTVDLVCDYKGQILTVELRGGEDENQGERVVRDLDEIFAKAKARKDGAGDSSSKEQKSTSSKSHVGATPA